MAEVSPLRLAGPGEADAIAALIRLAFSTQSVATEPPPSARLETGETVGGHFAAGGGGAVAGDFHAAALWMLEGEGFHVRRLSPCIPASAVAAWLGCCCNTRRIRRGCSAQPAFIFRRGFL
jgi:hypothetical protein